MIDFSASVRDMSDQAMADHESKVTARLGVLTKLNLENDGKITEQQKREIDRLFDRVIEINTEIVARRDRKDQAILDTATDFHRELDQ